MFERSPFLENTGNHLLVDITNVRDTRLSVNYVWMDMKMAVWMKPDGEVLATN